MKEDSNRFLVKRVLFSDGKSEPFEIYAEVPKSEVRIGEFTYHGRFICYGWRPGNLRGVFIRLLEWKYIGQGQPEARAFTG